MSVDSSQNRIAGHTILVMDDDADIRELFELNLERLGCKTVSASNGNEAIDLYTQSLETGNHIDAIIVDLNIPCYMGGSELATKLRALNSNIKMIVSSGQSNAPEMLDYKQHGFDAAIEKNFDREIMKHVLEQVLLN